MVVAETDQYGSCLYVGLSITILCYPASIGRFLCGIVLTDQLFDLLPRELFEVLIALRQYQLVLLCRVNQELRTLGGP